MQVRSFDDRVERLGGVTPVAGSHVFLKGRFMNDPRTGKPRVPGNGGGVFVWRSTRIDVDEAGLAEGVRPDALTITNDTQLRLQAHASPNCSPLALPDSTMEAGLGALLGQRIGTLDVGRANASEALSQRCMATTSRAQGQAIELSLFDCQQDHDFEAPLGWTLSGAARRQLQVKVDRLRFGPRSPDGTELDLLHHQQTCSATALSCRDSGVESAPPIPGVARYDTEQSCP